MRDDPYDQYGRHDQHGMGGELDAPPRTSAMSIASLVTSLGCVIPGVGLLAVVLGILALGLIGRARGRLSGRGLAATGIILGLIGTVIWGAVAAGGLQAWTFYTKQMAPVGDRAIMAAAAGDLDAVRAEMTQSAGQSVDAERMAFFIATIENGQGAIASVETNLSTIFQAFGRVSAGAQGGAGAGPQAGGDVTPVPVVLRCARGDVIAWPIFNTDSFGGGTLLLADIMVQLPNQQAVTLREDGEGAAFAQQLGWSIITPPGASQQQQQQDQAQPPREQSEPSGG